MALALLVALAAHRALNSPPAAVARAAGASWISEPEQPPMTTITTDTFAFVKANIDKLVQQAGVVIADVEDTVNDRARLMREAEEREAVIDRLNTENAELLAQIKTLEERNERLAADVEAMENRLSTATSTLAEIRRAAGWRVEPGTFPTVVSRT